MAQYFAFFGTRDAAFAWLDKLDVAIFRDIAPFSDHFLNALAGDARWPRFLDSIGKGLPNSARFASR